MGVYVEICGSPFPLVFPPRVFFAHCYDFFGIWLDGFCLCEGRGDGFVDNK